MRREVVDCDRCPQRDVKPVTVHIATGRSPDPAGGRSEPDYERIDLCGKCAEAVIVALLKPISFEEGDKIVKEIKTMKRRLSEGANANQR